MKIEIGDKLVGENEPCFIVADIGINHDGSLDIAKQLIKAAHRVGCDAVKFQKRTLEVVYTKEQLDAPSPYAVTNRELRERLEFGLVEYQEIDRYCKELGILWFASCWDEASVDFIDQFNPPCYKIASASLTDDNLLSHTKNKGKPIILSTGMSTIEQINHAVALLGQNNLIILHCTSTYPCKLEELNLNVIPYMLKQYKCPIGFSGHDVGIVTTVAASLLGAKVLERHITLDRSMIGYDHAASVEPVGFERIVRYTHDIERATGDGIKKVYKSELPILKDLRRIG